MKRRPRIFLFLMFAVLVGAGVWWKVDGWLCSRPDRFHLPDILGMEPQQVDRLPLGFDASQRWLTADELSNGGKHHTLHIIDMDHPSQPVRRLSWDDEEQTSHTAKGIKDGLREAIINKQGELVVIDHSFKDLTSTRKVLGRYEPSSVIQALISRVDNRVMVVQQWPLWPWKMLASLGQPPWETLLGNTNHIEYDPFHGLLLDIWDAGSGKHLKRHFFGPLVGHYLLSNNSKWFIVFPATNPPYRIAEYARPGKPFPLKTRSPYQLTVFNTETGETKLLEVQPPGEDMDVHQQANTRDDLLFLGFSRMSKTTGPAWDWNAGRYDSDEVYPIYDLNTGQRVASSEETPRLPALTSQSQLSVAGWRVKKEFEPYQQFEFLASLAKKKGWDLDKWLTGTKWRITFYDPKTNGIHYEKSIYFRGQLQLYSFFSPVHHAVLQGFNTGTGIEMYRWKVPFAIHSAWWSRAAGIASATVILLLGVLWMRRRRIT